MCDISICDLSSLELKKRKKFDGAWTASPAASAFTSFAYDVIPLLPFWVGQSAAFITKTGMTSTRWRGHSRPHQ